MVGTFGYGGGGKGQSDAMGVSRPIRSTGETELFLKRKVLARESQGMSGMLEMFLLCYHKG